MKKKSPRDLALLTLSRETTRSGPWVDSLDDVFLRNPSLNPRDRAFVSHLVNGVWRWRGRLDWMITRVSSRPLEEISPVVLDVLRMALYQVLYMDRVPESAAVNEAVKQVKALGLGHTAPFVNGLLRNLCRRINTIEFPDPGADTVRHLAVTRSYPEWLVARWVDVFGPAEAEALLCAQNRIPGLDIRVNRIKTTPADLMVELSREGVTARPVDEVPGCFCIEGLRGRVDRLDSFKAGLFAVQDRAAQIASHLLAPGPGEKVLDLCSGLGGKAAHLAELAGGGARVTALDIHPGRLLNLRRTMARLGIENVDPVAADGAADPAGLFRCRFDAVLLDAPCSGLGVLSRHPDAKWNRSPADLPRLASLQKALLGCAAEVLKPGGRILFVTCTITREENEGVVEAFLEERGDMRLEDLRDHAPAWALPFIDSQGFYRTLPHVHNMDGFFGALLMKR
jgi:16S rRNA (cytosine967-C5)-methyltransferase